MIVYHASKKRFLDDVFNGTIADDIDNAFVVHLGRHTSPNEILSWKNSMMHIYKVVNTDEIPDESDVAVEYQIPLTSKRIDFIISGLDGSGKENIVIIELKQWEHAGLSEKPGIVQTRFQHGESETAHPSYQAWSYAYMLENFNETVRNRDITLSPCAFLHNYQDDGIISNTFYAEFINKAPLFLKTDAKKLQDFIRKHIKHAPENDIIREIDNGRLRPSRQLADALCNMLNGNMEFVLLDDQKVIYETALALARKSANAEKHVLIVEGGPGTGKSVVAINLLVELTKEGIVSQYVSKNAAPRQVYISKLTDNFRKGYIENLSVFFVDDRQRIHIKDIGTRASIQKYAESCGAVVHTAKLSSQFRCNGSDGYLSWLDNTLQISETANIRLSPDDFDFRIFQDPNELFAAIKEKNRLNNKSRVVAGYCWDWKSQNDPDEFDITIPEFGFRKKWNLKTGKEPWLIGKNSIEEIGCIHTCQGLELDYVGVIVGTDMRFENGHVVTDVLKRSGNDQSVKGIKKELKEDRDSALQISDEIIKNTYRTLMTRGMKGCYVYCTDKALAQHIKDRLSSNQHLFYDFSKAVDAGMMTAEKVIIR